MSGVKEISVDQLKKMIDRKDAFLLLDVREKIELKYGKISVSKNIPMSELSKRLDELSKDRKIVVMCRSGKRSAKVRDSLNAEGFSATSVYGGILAWKKYDASIISY
ncbi:MAG: rhodanese-like domain-containing protein [Nanoarchaeota archaeon]|nr:rhodanese-like domain-containing protein [Nanoarchaeota archaeon]